MTKNFKKILRLNKLPDYDDLSFEQKSLVIEKEYRNIVCTLPKKFYVKHLQAVADYLNKTSQHGNYTEDKAIWSHFPAIDGYHCFLEPKEGYVEINQEQFQKYIKLCTQTTI